MKIDWKKTDQGDEDVWLYFPTAKFGGTGYYGHVVKADFGYVWQYEGLKHGDFTLPVVVGWRPFLWWAKLAVERAAEIQVNWWLDRQRKVR